MTKKRKIAALKAPTRKSGDADYENMLLSAIRYEFGGRIEKSAA
jgi:hypothetical protein